jgi:hypothetical protein
MFVISIAFSEELLIYEVMCKYGHTAWEASSVWLEELGLSRSACRYILPSSVFKFLSFVPKSVESVAFLQRVSSFRLRCRVVAVSHSLRLKFLKSG